MFATIVILSILLNNPSRLYTDSSPDTFRAHRRAVSAWDGGDGSITASTRVAPLPDKPLAYGKIYLNPVEIDSEQVFWAAYIHTLPEGDHDNVIVLGFEKPLPEAEARARTVGWTVLELPDNGGVLRMLVVVPSTYWTSRLSSDPREMVFPTMLEVLFPKVVKEKFSIDRNVFFRVRDPEEIKARRFDLDKR